MSGLIPSAKYASATVPPVINSHQPIKFEPLESNSERLGLFSDFHFSLTT